MTINEEKLLILLWLWGDEYFYMLEHYTLPCLRAQKFKSSETILLIYTKPEKSEQTKELAGRLLDGFFEYEIGLLPEVEHIGLGSTRLGIERARKENCRMLWITPDMILSHDSIVNMQTYACGKPVTVSAIDLRADYDAFKKDFPTMSFPMKSSDLVSIALKYPHQCTTTAIDRSGTYKSGQSLTKLHTPGLWSIVYRIPTPFLCYFTENDQLFWDEFKEGIGGWDHVWPEQLARDQRFRFMGNSDMAFVLHLTSKHHANAPLHALKPHENENFYREQYHHEVLGNLVGALRSNE